ncbi:hypothetical protein BpHYR1_015746 [Brachionus plicatilis]|uniref:Chitin-binding type-2 domain-containing protein n=1 Tax=Brachionus plicatilis TaxID=10195 RepID=A0A3M7PCH6_BRAPC|nr:hypothetical protein BpHYR1_015746 [Brachionus plicatilis]
MIKENGNYSELYYCNVYHNSHGGFDTVQYCANGLVWRQDTLTSGTCDWTLNRRISKQSDCGSKKMQLIKNPVFFTTVFLATVFLDTLLFFVVKF